MRNGKEILNGTLEGKNDLGEVGVNWKIRMAGLHMRSPEMRV